jgi:hypothetical protein
MNPRVSIFLVLICAASPAVHAGSVLELVTTEYSEDPPIVGTVEITTEGKESRIEITSVSSDESGGMIYRSNKREMIALDHATREYYVFDQAMMDLMAAQVRAALEQTKAALDAMSPEERALAEQMLQRPAADDDSSAGRAKLIATGQGDTIAGYKCKYYDVVRAGKKFRDICMTPWTDIPQGREASHAMMELSEFFEDMREAFAGAGGLDEMDRQQEMFTYMEQLDAYPVLSHDYDIDGEIESESRLKAARMENVSATLFEPPSGYRQRDLQ